QPIQASQGVVGFAKSPATCSAKAFCTRSANRSCASLTRVWSTRATLAERSWLRARWAAELLDMTCLAFLLHDVELTLPVNTDVGGRPVSFQPRGAYADGGAAAYWSLVPFAQGRNPQYPLGHSVEIVPVSREM